MELVRDDVKVVWHDDGEGYRGEYDPTDPTDMPLLRFAVYERQGGNWEAVQDASYCTNFPAIESNSRKKAALELLMSEFYDLVTKGASVKKLGEWLSWISPDWVESGDIE